MTFVNPDWPTKKPQTHKITSVVSTHRVKRNPPQYDEKDEFDYSRNVKMFML